MTLSCGQMASSDALSCAKGCCPAPLLRSWRLRYNSIPADGAAAFISTDGNIIDNQSCCGLCHGIQAASPDSTYVLLSGRRDVQYTVLLSLGSSARLQEPTPLSS
jgi:hypothetical protein